MVELVDRPHQAEVALLDQVEQLHPAPRIALGDAHHQPQVGLRELALGALAALHAPDQHPLLGRVGDALVDLLRRGVAFLDQLRQPALVLGGEQVDLADLTQVQPHRVAGAALDTDDALLTAPAPAPRQQALDVFVVEHDLALRAVPRRVVVLDLGDRVVDVDARVAPATA